MLRSYCLYIEDCRYTVPTLLFVNAIGEGQAREIAAEKLAESRFYKAITVWDGDTRLCVILANPVDG